MLIGIVSDTHENMPQIRKAVEYFNMAKVSAVFHAGDIISPLCAEELKKLSVQMFAVFGNNDGEKCGWRERIKGWGEIQENTYEVTLDGRKIVMMHDPRLLDALAESQQFDVIIYGHTHRIDQRQVGKTLIVNPGECGGWMTGKSTVAVLNLENQELQIIDLTA